MNKWVYKVIYIFLESGQYVIRFKSKLLEGAEVLDFINQLGDEGWELVSVVQRIGNEINVNSSATGDFLVAVTAGPQVTDRSQHKAVTLGYTLWFKRQKE
jgi:hypothetical protein